MSWFDLAVLTLILWVAAQGYVSGVSRVCLHFCCTLFSVCFAYILYKPLTVFAQQEWQLEGFFVSWYTNRTPGVLATMSSESYFLPLPTIAAPALRLLMPEKATLPVMASKEIVLSYLSVLTVRLLAVLIFAAFLLALSRLFIRLRYERGKGQPLLEWHRTLGMLVGGAHGVVLAFVACTAIDALTLLVNIGIFQSDFTNSYLARVTSYCLQRMF
ncbi:MAG: CvpA family protein [Firmicutes bacterium]|nr:CvpA family protein [Bacillota bacterium]